MAPRGKRAARGGAGGPKGGPAPAPTRDWAGGLPPELLEAVARAVPAGDRLWFRLVCRSWAAAGAAVGEEPLPPGKVTRTHWADVAASVARAEIALGVLERPVREKFKSTLCWEAAPGGHLEVLQWARAQGHPWAPLGPGVPFFWGRLPLLPPPPFSPPLPPILPDRHPSHYPSSFTPPPSGPTVAPRPGVWKMCKRGHLIFAKSAGDSLRCPLPWIAGRRRREQRRRAGQTLPRRRRARDEEGDNARGRTRGDGLGGGSRKLVT